MCVVKTPSARISSEPTLALVLVVAELARRTAMLATNVALMLLANRHALILMSVLIQRSIIVRALRLVLILSESSDVTSTRMSTVLPIDHGDQSGKDVKTCATFTCLKKKQCLR